MSRVYVTRPIPANGIEILKKGLGDDNVSIFSDDRIIKRDELLAGVPGAEAILSILTDPIDADVMDAAGSQLRIISNYAVGFNNIDVDEATRRGILVTNTPGVLTEATADLAWALLMAAARRISESERYLRAGQWEGWGPQQFLGMDVCGQTLGVFGMGRIGQAVARRAQGFGMRVIYTKRNRLDAETEQALNAKHVDKDTLVRESDFLSLHSPLSPETEHAFGPEEFKAMKSTAILINTSRGAVVDEAALARALKNGDIAGAGIDVYEKEPEMRPELMECENAVLIPHLGSATHATRARMAEMAAESIVTFLQGGTPKNVVNPDALA